MSFVVPQEFIQGIAQPRVLDLRNYKQVPSNKDSQYSLSFSETDPFEDSLCNRPKIEDSLQSDSFLVTKDSMNFQSAVADYNIKCEVYSPELMPAAFANSIKIETRKQLGSGGQAQVFECKFRSETGTVVCVDKLQKVFNNSEICASKF
jgi:hypothetical protein